MPDRDPVEMRRRDGRVYQRAVTPGLRKLLVFLVVLLAPLGANSVYLAAITFLGFVRGATYENQFYNWMFLVHLVLGIILIPPFVYFAWRHVRNVVGRRNRRVMNAGWRLLAAAGGVILTGILMTLRLFPSESVSGRVSYWLHLALPVLCLFFYVSHRLYGPAIKWRWGIAYAVSVAVFTGIMTVAHGSDPRAWNIRGGGEAYFFPSEARTANLGFIPARALQMDQYCVRCHPDAVKQHAESVHKLSSFNNPIYLMSVRETRELLLARDGNVKGARFCAGCHDPVPFFSGAFDDPDFDDVHHPTVNEGVNCTVCHAITDVYGTVGNANFTIEEPLHYPFAYSDNPFLLWVNEQLVKAKPAFHKKTFLKPMHKTAEFCTVCHKVNIPGTLNGYKEWLRGQNHYDNFLLSGVSGNGARSFYYPPKAEPNCNECHLPPIDSDDIAARDGKVHDHRFPGSNTGVPALKGLPAQADYQKDFLEDGQMLIDIFALREEGRIDGTLIAPLRPELPTLQPGRSYLVEVVIRTQKLGHVFTQGTSDSNEVWVELQARSGDKLIGSSGLIDDRGEVDRWAHFLNTYMLDKDGNRIARRNVADIFVPLYSHQMPPGTGQVVHYRLDLPADLAGPVSLSAELRYRKFDDELMEHAYDHFRQRGEWQGAAPEIPIAIMARDEIVLPVGAGQEVATVAEPKKPLWQRWRDYGIGLLLKGNSGSNKGQLRQAEEAFRVVADLGRPEGYMDLARTWEKEGRLDDARGALAKAVETGYGAPWTINWLSGVIDMQNGNYPAAIANFENVLSTRIPERGFDFSRDYMVRSELGRAYLLAARAAEGPERDDLAQRAIAAFKGVLAEDAENLGAHYNLMLCYRLVGDREQAARHEKLHAKYKPDENARDRAVALARKRDPAADHAAESVVIYDLGRGRKD
ncbi:MAG: hypothetical protein H6807_04500 [Planctomycetes bacterium]|nr:hypothetical protein [Planctomycetota bacterium]